MLKERIIDKLDSYFKGSDRFIVEVKVAAGDRVAVFVDGMKDISIGECVEISRMLEDFLESEGLVREDYGLEVSSPGLDQPFRVREQYEKSLGRDLEVLRKDGIKLEGKLVALEDDSISIEVEKKKKNKVTDTERIDISLSDIKSTKQLINFKK